MNKSQNSIYALLKRWQIICSYRQPVDNWRVFQSRVLQFSQHFKVMRCRFLCHPKVDIWTTVSVELSNHWVHHSFRSLAISQQKNLFCTWLQHNHPLVKRQMELGIGQFATVVLKRALHAWPTAPPLREGILYIGQFLSQWEGSSAGRVWTVAEDCGEGHFHFLPQGRIWFSKQEYGYHHRKQ